jgi:pyruvyltransferase
MFVRFCKEKDYPNNIGDSINSVIFEYFTQKKITSNNCLDTEEKNYEENVSILGIGSVIQHSNKNDIVFGTGCMNIDFPMKIKPKKIISVRGPLTRNFLIKNNINAPEIYGDPALLLPLIYNPKRNIKYKLGIIPHYIDKKEINLEKFLQKKEIKIIDIQSDYKKFVDDLVECEYVISSSLHGIIFSDAYNIPAYPCVLNKIDVDVFKFHDYFISVNRNLQIVEKSSDIYEIIKQMKPYKIQYDILKLLDIFPFIDEKIKTVCIEKINNGLYSHFTNLSIFKDFIDIENVEFLNEEKIFENYVVKSNVIFYKKQKYEVNEFEKIQKFKFEYMILSNNTELKLFPFNFCNFTMINKDFLLLKYDDFLYNCKNLNKLFIKNHDGEKMKKYIMYQFHEEFTNYLGNFDDNFVHQDDVSKYFLNKYGTLPKSIMFFWNFSDDIIKKIRIQIPKCKIVLWVDDLHWFNENQYKLNLKNYTESDFIISHYNHFDLFYNLKINEKLWLFPHSCSSHFFSENINKSSENKIFMYGAIDKQHYPLRVEFLDLMNKHYKNLFYYKEHPGYHQSSEKQSLDTAKELNKYSFCFTTGIFPYFSVKEPESANYYLVGKFFEIMGNGVLLLCNNYGVKKQLNELGFYDKKHYIHIDNNNFHEIINWLFDKENENEIFEIRERAYLLVKKFHRTINRCKDINFKFTNL